MPRIYSKGVEIVPGFRLVELLGRGGFGEVWKVNAPGGTEAAVKILSLVERYGFKEFRAIQRVKQIRHPNLVPIYGFWLKSEDGKFFDPVDADSSFARRAQDLELILAMGIGEKNLLDRLRECQKEGKAGIPVEELLNYMQDAAKAIDYLNQPIHESDEGSGGIQHCDIKPQNVLIVGGSAQVCDFGLARVLGDAQMTTAKGTAAYMAPELVLDNRPSKATDQYFLAISYCELRTGSLPLDVSSPATAIWAHAHGRLDLTKLPTAEQVVIRRATSLEPDKRFPNCVEMVRALRRASAQVTPTTKPGFRPTRADELAPGSEVVPGYRLIKLLGKGGYGQVWEALAPGGKHVALKIIRNLDGTQGRQEFRALELIKTVDHNHLMELHAYWLLDRDGNVIPDSAREQANAPEASTLVIASKLASQNLLQRLGECQAAGLTGIPLVELIGYMWQAAQAIDYLNEPRHKMGDRKVSIQHRDIKPENILLAANVVKVGDFGLAKVLEGTSAVIHGESAGLTLAYAAPEMFTNLVTRWSDQYSLAVTYYRLRTGVLPFPPGSKANDIVKMHVRGFLDLSRVDGAEREVMARATAVKPEERYPSCSVMVEALDAAVKPIALGEEKDPTLDQALMPAGKGLVLPPTPAPPAAAAKAAEPAPNRIPDPRVITVRPEGIDDSVEAKKAPVKAAPAPAPQPAPPTRVDLELPPAPPPPVPPPKPAKPAPAAAPAAVVPTPTVKEAPKEAKAGTAVTPAAPAKKPSSVVRKAPTAAWKGTAQPRVRKRKPNPYVPVVLTTVFVAVLAVGLVLAWMFKSSHAKEMSQRVRQDVAKLLGEREFEAAFERTHNRELPQADLQQLRDEVRDAWLEHGTQELLKDSRHVASIDRALSNKYAADAKVKAFHQQVKTAKEVRALVNDKELEQASAVLAKEEKRLPEPLVTQLRYEMIQPRLADAEDELAAGQADKAEQIAGELLDRFPGNPSALAMRGKARAAHKDYPGALNDFTSNGLSDGSNVTTATLPLLLARIEFYLTSDGEKHLKKIAAGDPLLETYLSYVDQAEKVAGTAPLRERVRTAALDLRLSLRAAQDNKQNGAAKLRTRADEAFQRARALVSQHPDDWASALELARQLNELAKDPAAGKPQRYRDEAARLLDQVRDRAAPDVWTKRGEPLLRELRPAG